MANMQAGSPVAFAFPPQGHPQGDSRERAPEDAATAAAAAAAAPDPAAWPTPAVTPLRLGSGGSGAARPGGATAGGAAATGSLPSLRHRSNSRVNSLTIATTGGTGKHSGHSGGPLEGG